MKKQYALLVCLLVLMFLIGIPAGIVLRDYRHIQMNRALQAAIRANDTGKALAALKAGAEANYPSKLLTARPIWLQWVDKILSLPVENKEAGPSLLAQAVQHNNTVLVKVLLDNGATDVEGYAISLQDRENVEAMPLLAIAAEAGNVEICQALVAHGVEVDSEENSCALQMAAKRGQSAVIRFLFEHGATLDTPEWPSGECSLMAAARSGDFESVRLLLAHGADANLTGRFSSALSDAVHGGSLAVVKLLVEAGADVNGGGAYTCVLQDAACVGDVEIVRYLLKHGANVNQDCRWNRTPLLEAVEGGHPRVVRLLLENGADWRPKEAAGGMGFTQGDSALGLARRDGKKEIVQILKAAGAKE